MRSIPVQELKTILDSGKCVDLVDVRTPAEHATAHVPGTRVAPVDKLNCQAVLNSRQGESKAPIYILCHSGTRAAQAAEKFAKAGFDNAVVVEGGTQAWIAAGYPVNRGNRKVLSLDRQVRTTAGLMALAGALLAEFHHPAWIWLCGFVGFGLIVAGLTDFCPMRILLAAMPWNQTGEGRKSKNCCCEA